MMAMACVVGTFRMASTVAAVCRAWCKRPSNPKEKSTITGLNSLGVITLFVEDLPAAKQFYTDVFGLEVIHEDRHGVKLLNGPVDRPWGPRTATFADPAGNIWEIAGDPK